MMPRWPRWWSVELEYDADGQLIVAQMGKDQEIRRIDADQDDREGDSTA